MRLFRNKPSRYLRMLLSKIHKLLMKVTVAVNTANVTGTKISWGYKSVKLWTEFTDGKVHPKHGQHHCMGGILG